MSAAALTCAGESPAISIVVPCRNEKKHILPFLEGLDRQEGIEHAEVILADGMSQDGTRSLLASFRPKRFILQIIDNPEKIAPTGLNAAIRMAKGPIILRMDVHAEYAPDYVVRCCEMLERSGAHNVGGPSQTKAKGYVGQAVAAAFHSRFGSGGAKFHDLGYEGYVDTVQFGCWKKATLEALGLFDEKLVRNQDDELNLRLIRWGGKIWQSPRIVFWYHPRSSLGSLFRQQMQYGYWKVAVIRKHGRPASWRHVVPAAFVAVNAGLAALTALAGLSGMRPAADYAAPIWMLAASMYGICSLGASVVTGLRFGYKYIPILPAVFAIYHFGYGIGFLCGLVREFAPARGTPARDAFTAVTR
jgi:glycosyltransferase involved in cell wall biosynthesis